MIRAGIEMEAMMRDVYEEYKNNGGIISPMNTESCRRYLQEKNWYRSETRRCSLAFLSHSIND